jgi:hypothetical protein
LPPQVASLRRLLRHCPKETVRADGELKALMSER